MALVSGRAIAHWDAWLKPLDALPLECDGMTRVISTLLQRQDIAHQVFVGSLLVRGVGSIPLHYWISLGEGAVCDLRARMWLGAADGVPHGISYPGAGTIYTAAEKIEFPPSDFLFEVLVGKTISQIPTI